LLSALAASGSNLRQATVEDVQAALEALRTKEDAASVRPATVNTYVAAVMSFLGFAHRVGFARFNAGPLIKLKKALRQIAQRILSEAETAVDRDRLMFDLAYFGGLRVSELASLTWGQVIRRDSGEAQLSIVGKGSKSAMSSSPRSVANQSAL
jgi:site-specific recombinase XerD